jgi:hypothetical protein
MRRRVHTELKIKTLWKNAKNVKDNVKKLSTFKIHNTYEEAHRSSWDGKVICMMDQIKKKSGSALIWWWFKKNLSFCRPKGKVQKPETKFVASNGQYCACKVHENFTNTRGSGKDGHRYKSSIIISRNFKKD